MPELSRFVLIFYLAENSFLDYNIKCVKLSNIYLFSNFQPLK